MTMQKLLATTVGSILALAYLAAPGIAYGQVDERTEPGTQSQNVEQPNQQGSDSHVKPATPKQKALLSEISSAIGAVSASAKGSVVHIEVTEGDRARSATPGSKGKTPGRTPGRSAPNRNQDNDDNEEQDQGPQDQGPHGQGFNQLPPDIQDQLRRFFGGQIPEPSEPTPRRGLGSGIVYDNKGHILTNNHVVGGASKIVVRTTTGRKLDAEVVGTDPLTDVAVIKIIKGNGLKPAEFGDSSKVDVGDLVLAMGNPFGLDFSVTFGIISAKGRGKGLQLGNIYYKDFLQTDAAINPGNSGGPLINMDGQVIGMNTAIATQTGQYAGVGFAIPSNLARRIADILIEKGKVTRGWLGVGIDDLDPEMAQSFKLPPDKEGVLVQDVKSDSPAAEAGFQQGDIILQIDGKPVHNATHLQTSVTLTPPGTKVTFQVWRYDSEKNQGKMMNLTVELGELKESFLRGMNNEEEGPAQPGGTKRYKSEDLGITYTTPTADLAKQFGWTETPKGAMVVKVDPAGEAANLSIQEGDVIDSVNNAKITSAKDLQDALKKVSSDESFRMYVRGPRFGGRYVLVQP